MSTKALNYKTYQQVLDLATEKVRVTKATKPEVCAKKRTKSGCLTCRRRKKKCDEEKVGGKCQACIRNFLDCCWPGEVANEHPETEVVGSVVADTSEPVSVKTEKTPAKSTGASAYPSPLLSPQAEAADDHGDIKPIELPSPRVKKVTKPTKKRAARKAKAPAQFIVTSFDLDRALCQVKV